MDLLSQRARRRSQVAGALFLALVLGGGACVSVLGLSDDRYQDSDAAVVALCARFAAVCTGLVDESLFWGSGTCDSFLEQSPVALGGELGGLTPCFQDLSCPMLLDCWKGAGVELFTSTGVPEGDLCLDQCPMGGSCSPWQCGLSQDVCTAAVPELDAGADAGLEMGADAGNGMRCEPSTP